MTESNREPLTAPLLRIVLKHLLTALDFLHTEAEVIHTGMIMVLITRSKLSHRLDVKFEGGQLNVYHHRKVHVGGI